MNEIKKAWKQYKKIIIPIAIGIATVPPILVHVFFKMRTGVDFFVSEWTAGGFLEYIATVISFIGTMILSIVAIYSSTKANELSNRITDIEQDKYKLDLRPFVIVTGWKAFLEESSEIQYKPERKYIQIGEFNQGQVLCFSLELTNTTSSWISVEFLHGEAINHARRNSAVNQSNLKMHLMPVASDRFVFYATQECIEKLLSGLVTIELILENRFSKRYKESFSIILTSLSYLETYRTDEWFCRVYAQDYSIKRFELNDNQEPVLVPEEL